MVAQTLDQQLLALIGYHARTVRKESTFPTGALIPQVRVCSVCCGPVEPKYSSCYPCNKRVKQFREELADIVVPLSYAVRGYQALQQFYSDFYTNTNLPSLQSVLSGASWRYCTFSACITKNA